MANPTRKTALIDQLLENFEEPDNRVREMRALTVRQPWAAAIAYGGKHTENRSWPAPAKYHGTRILIHAGRSYDPMARFVIGDSTLQSLPDVRGAVIALATLTGCHKAPAEGCCTPWGEPDTWHWQLTHVTPLHTPIPCKGALGLWRPDSDVADALTSQLRESEET